MSPLESMIVRESFKHRHFTQDEIAYEMEEAEKREREEQEERR
jgi:hypothetical protein